MSKHTPGPWISNCATVTKSDGFKIRVLYPRGAAPEAWSGISDNLHADAKLVAAAPDMLEALRLIGSQSLCPDWSAQQAFDFMRSTAKAALNKAGA